VLSMTADDTAAGIVRTYYSDPDDLRAIFRRLCDASNEVGDLSPLPLSLNLIDPEN
jgi:hypothetical protein